MWVRLSTGAVTLEKSLLGSGASRSRKKKKSGILQSDQDGIIYLSIVIKFLNDGRELFSRI